MAELVAYNLSPQQQHFWLLRKHTDRLYAQVTLLVSGTLDKSLLRHALRRVINEHAIFKTTYHYSAGAQLVQVVNAEAEFEFTEIKINSTEELEPVLELARGLVGDAQSKLRLHALLALLPDKCLLILTMPSVCADLWSLSVFVKQMAQSYAFLKTGNSEPHSESVPYLQFAEWQNQLLLTEEVAEGRDYWRIHQVAPAQLHELPFEQLPPPGQVFTPAFFELTFDSLLVSTVRKTLSSGEYSLEEFLSLCWHTVIWHLLDKQPTAVGHVNVFRDFEELSGTIGLLCRCIPVATPLIKEATFLESLRTHHRLLEANDEYKSFYLPDESHSGGSLPYAFEFIKANKHYKAADITFEVLFQRSLCDTSKLKLTVIEQENNIDCTLQFDARHLSRESTEFIGHAFLAVVEQCVADLGVLVNDVSLLDSYYTEKILRTFVGTAEAAGEKNIVELFEEQALQYPDQTALVCASKSLSYGELNKGANGLAAHLRERLDVHAGDLVGLMCGANEHLIVGMLGILKSGAAFVPIDIQNPPERREFILRDSKVKAVVIESDLQSHLTGYNGPTVGFDTDENAWHSTVEQRCLRTNEHLAYAIYTSGTTGQPKGILIRDKSLANYVCWLRDTFSLTPGDSSILLSSYAFDLGYTSIWGTLLTGGTLHLVSDNFLHDPEALILYLTRQQISFIKTTPSLFQLIVNAANVDALESCNLRLVLLGGEPIRVKDLERFAALAPGATLVNHYGPTESTIGAIAHRIDQTSFATYRKHPVIGRPILNTIAYVLDEHQKLVAPGLDGELCVSGIGLAQGYLNREALSEEKFIENPFAPGTKMYRTGDLARWLPDGTILYLGRKDDQVKIRGYRIELGDVQHALLQHNQVREAVVIAHDSEDFGQELVAYFIADGELKVTELRSFLAKRLPEYMVPSYWVQLDAFPLTPNRKLDRKALPAPDIAVRDADMEYVAPRNETERRIAALWKQVLGQQSIGIRDNFFQLGGHSLKAIQLISRLKEAFDVEISLAAFFENPFIEDLALLILQEAMEQGDSEDFDQVLARLEADV